MVISEYPFEVWSQLQILSLTSFAHTWCATLKVISLLSAEIIMQPRNSPRSRKGTEEFQMLQKKFEKQSPCKLYTNIYMKTEKSPFRTFLSAHLSTWLNEIAKTRLRSLMVLISQGTPWNSQHLEAVVFMPFCKWDHGKVLSYLLEMELW